MKVRVDMELNDRELDELAAVLDVQFLTADTIHAALEEFIRAQLAPPVVELGPLHSIIYTRPEDTGADVGYRHVFRPTSRPRLCWDGRNLQTRGGRYRVTDSTGIVDTSR